MKLDDKRLRIVVVLALALFLNGCVAAHLIEGLKELGATAASRKQLLKPEVNRFHSAADTGRIMIALKLVEEQSRDLFREELRQMSREENIVDRKIEIMDFSDSAYKANVESLVKSFSKVNRIVTERIEKESWVFHTTSGWKILSREFSDL